MKSVSTLRPRVLAQPRAARVHLRVQSNYFWTLHSKRHPDRSKDVDLTPFLKERRKCSVASHDLAERATEPIDLTIVASGGTHLLFTCEGAHPVDLPSDLYVIDVDSEVPVKVDGNLVEKGSKCILHPGAVLQIGDESFEIQRNVQAHA